MVHRPGRWNVELAQSGPAVVAPDVRRDIRPTGHPVRHRPTVTAVSPERLSVSFHVSRVGTPVLVKVSYFPNWHASGADGPWRVTPNLMVVVPTSHDVTLTYGRSAADDLGQLATLARADRPRRHVRGAGGPALGLRSAASAAGTRSGS